MCTWNSADSSSLATNRDNAATNLFYNVNRWHDHLLAAPIGFDEASGNFERVNSTGQGEGGDSVQAENNDGGGFDNAFFNTPPDGVEPTMAMWPRTRPRPPLRAQRRDRLPRVHPRPDEQARRQRRGQLDAGQRPGAVDG